MPARLTGWFLLGVALRLAWLFGIRFGLLLLLAKLWPSVLVAMALRRVVLPPLRERFDRLPDLCLYGAATAVLVLVCVVPATAVTEQFRAYLDAYGFLPLGPTRREQALQSAPLALLAGVLIAAAWPGIRWIPPLSVLRRWGERLSAAPGAMTRTTDHGQRQVLVRPQPAQYVATGKDVDDDWFCEQVHGRGILSVLVAPAGVGKTDLVNGTLSAAQLGEAFAGRLTTRKPHRVLVLSEMSDRTMRKGLRRWGFFTPPTGLWHALRLRLRPDSFIDVLWASDVLKLRAAGFKPEWHEVVHALKPRLKRGKYDLLIVDSLGRWMGNDSSNPQMLAAFGLLRELIAEFGLGVLVLHHCSKDEKPPYRPRGGTAIEAEPDIIWSLARLPDVPDPLHDPRRLFECVKSRDAENAPPPLLIERVLDDGWGNRPHFRLLGGAAQAQQRSQRVVVEVTDVGWSSPPPPLRPSLPPPAPDPTEGLPEREAAVLATLIRRGTEGATARFLADGPLIGWGSRAYKAICEALVRLEKLGLVRQQGTEATPGGGPAARVYVASAVADPADAVAAAERILRTARKGKK